MFAWWYHYSSRPQRTSYKTADKVYDTDDRSLNVYYVHDSEGNKRWLHMGRAPMALAKWNRINRGLTGRDRFYPLVKVSVHLPV